jgi:hypothetical protein
MMALDEASMRLNSGYFSFRVLVLEWYASGKNNYSRSYEITAF